MQHTLIPYKERTKLHREYSMRVVGISILILSIALFAGAASIFPSYLYASFYNRAAENTIADIKSSKADQGLDKATKELSANNKTLTALSAGDDSPDYSSLVESMLTVNQPVSIYTFRIYKSTEKGKTDEWRISISGVAPTRNELIAFKARLEKLFATKIEIPIEQLAKSSKPSYSIIFPYKKP